MTACGVLKTIYDRGGVTVSSDFSREHARTIGALASAGFLTTYTFEPEDPYGRVWHPSSDGLVWLHQEGREK